MVLMVGHSLALFLSNCLLKDHNRGKLTRLSDWKMTVDAELEVLSKSYLIFVTDARTVHANFFWPV